MVDAATRARKALSDPDLQDEMDQRHSGPETPQEMHERMVTEDASEEMIDVLEGLRSLQGAEPIKWHIYRVGASEASLNGYLATWGNSQLTQENIAGKFGGGRYRIRGQYANGTWAGGRTIEIAGDAPRREDTLMTAQNQAPAFNAQEFLALQEAREEKRRAEAKRDRMELITILGPIIAPIIAAMVGKPAAPATDLPALITALRPTVQPENPLNSMKGMMEMLSMMKDITGDGGGSETAEILKAVSGIAAPILTAVAQRPPGAPVRARLSAPTSPGAPIRGAAPSPVAPPATVRAAPPPVVLPMDQPTTVHVNPATQPGADLSAPTNLQDNAMFAQMKPQIEALVSMAAQGADPIAVADTFFEQALLAMPQEIYDQILDLLEHPQFISRIGIFSPDVKTHEAFFVALKDRLLLRAKQESETAQQAGAA